MTTDRQEFDSIVVGSGLAGLTYALRSHGRVCILTKGEVTDSNTSWAQGGIAAAVGEADDWVLHKQDTLIAGAGLCNEAAVRFLVQNATAAIEWLRHLGARFDLLEGDLALGREGGIAETASFTMRIKQAGRWSEPFPRPLRRSGESPSSRSPLLASY